MKSRIHRLGIFALLSLLVLSTSAASAITISIDYEHDTGFFTGNAQARAAVEAAAGFYSDLLLDTFSSIETPERIFGTNGSASWRWVATYRDPTSGLTQALVDPEFDADEYRIYVGARNLVGDQVGQAAPGGFRRGMFQSSRFSAPAGTNVGQINNAFKSAVEDRGETSGFASWGGSVAFDNATTWHFNHNVAPAAGTTDFYSVALHEIAHALGFGGSEEWTNLVTGTNFTGAAARAENGGADVPLASADDLAHWPEGRSSVVLGTSTVQNVAMDQSLAPATRLLLTDLDAAALQDIGWTLSSPFAALSLSSALTIDDSAAGDMVSSVGFASAAISVPEPASAFMLLIALSGCALAMRRR
jgi:hypothetical protein